MAKETKYHPVDVRYKGPSTAYRGSAKWGKSSLRTNKAAPAKSSPWDAKPTAAVPQTPAKPAKPDATPKDAQSRGIGFWAVIAFLFYLIFF